MWQSASKYQGASTEMHDTHGSVAAPGPHLPGMSARHSPHSSCSHGSSASPTWNLHGRLCMGSCTVGHRPPESKAQGRVASQSGRFLEMASSSNVGHSCCVPATHTGKAEGPPSAHKATQALPYLAAGSQLGWLKHSVLDDPLTGGPAGCAQRPATPALLSAAARPPRPPPCPRSPGAACKRAGAACSACVCPCSGSPACYLACAGASSG
jgi:hypothetical protein